MARTNSESEPAQKISWDDVEIYFTNSSPLKNPTVLDIREHLSLRQKENMARGLVKQGIRLKRWSIESTTGKEAWIKRGIYGGLIAAAALFTFTEGTQVIQAGEEIIQRGWETVAAYGSIDFSKVDPLKSSFQNLGGAFEPVTADRQLHIDQARQALDLQFNKIIDLAKWTLGGGVTTLVLALKRHPFSKTMEIHSTTFGPKIGWALECLGRN